jgi:coatomer protein complex subunit alpha (xenin)
LNRQISVVDFTPLKPLFLQAYQSAHISVPANPSLPPLTFHVRRNPDTTEMREVLPVIPAGMSLDEIKAGELTEASRYFSRGKFGESLSAYRGVLVKLLMVVVNTQAEADEVSRGVADDYQL